jgi:hypothetical protein
MKKKILIFSVPLFLVAVLTGIYLLNGCQKDVGVITNIVKYDVSGYVLNSQTAAGIEGAKIYLDGITTATTDTAGKYTIEKLKPGSYLITAKKDGYSDGWYNITVSSDGVIAKAIMLKELSPSVTIGADGGLAIATNTSGSTVAELSIPAGEFSASKQISVTNLVGNEVPKVLASTNKLLGTTVTLHSDDSNISFTNGATLTFKLPFRHKPGDVVEADYFNETTNAWETYQNAVVNNDGLTASITVHHFSTYSVSVNGTYSEEINENIGYQVIATSDDYKSQYDWESSLEYRANVTDSIDHEWLYTTVEGQTKLNFSTISYGGTKSSANTIVRVRRNISTITPPPIENPEGYRHLPKRHWELVRICCWVHEIVAAQVWMQQYGGYINNSVPNWYQVCSYIWIWRPSDAYTIPVICYLYPPVIIIIIDQHQGGSGS